MESELIPANIVIGDRSYRIKILPSDEEVVRKTLKVINDKITEFRIQFGGKDMQDYIAMVLIWYATKPQSDSGIDTSNKEFLEKLMKINKQLDVFI
ncbi:MAG: cell division protein ZapA [Ginsengibacter sp.]